MKTKVFAAAACAGLLTLSPATAAAQDADLFGPLPYLEAADSPFAGVDGWAVEDFESHALTLPGTTASTGESTVTAGFFSAYIDSVDGDDGVIDGLGRDGDSWFFGSSVTFSFDDAVLGSLPTHVGIVWTDGATGNVTVEFYDAASASLGSITAMVGDGNFIGYTDEDRFFGAVYEDGISAVTLTQPGAGIEVDHLQYAFATNPVPEPTTCALALAALCLAAKRRR